MQKRRAFELMTRVGFAARGLLYIVVGVLVIGTGRAEDLSGVLEYLGGGLGNVLLLAMAGGFAAYGLWRLADAAFAIECRGDDHEGWKRLGSAISGAVHLYLANQSWDIATGVGKVSETGAQDQAQELLRMPAGQLLLGVVALGLLAAGIVQLAIAAKCTFLQRLDERVRETWVKWLGRAGYAARGIVFLMAGYFVGSAALSNRSAQAGGMEQALEWLSSPVNYIIAGGLLLFGIYALVEARYRRIHTPHAADVKRQLPDAVTG